MKNNIIDNGDIPEDAHPAIKEVYEFGCRSLSPNFFEPFLAALQEICLRQRGCSPKRESGEQPLQIKRTHELLFSNCPKCGERLIRNSRGIECGEIHCNYTADSIENKQSKEKKNEER